MIAKQRGITMVSFVLVMVVIGFFVYMGMVLGPAYRDVAAKYAGQDGMVDKLTIKVLSGGSGVWGAMPMPPNIQVTEAEARMLVKWVLQLK